MGDEVDLLTHSNSASLPRKPVASAKSSRIWVNDIVHTDAAQLTRRSRERAVREWLIRSVDGAGESRPRWI